HTMQCGPRFTSTRSHSATLLAHTTGPTPPANYPLGRCWMPWASPSSDASVPCSGAWPPLPPLSRPPTERSSPPVCCSASASRPSSRQMPKLSACGFHRRSAASPQPSSTPPQSSRPPSACPSSASCSCTSAGGWPLPPPPLPVCSISSSSTSSIVIHLPASGMATLPRPGTRPCPSLISS